MVALQREFSKGRDFTAEELIGRQIRIEGPVPKKKMPPLGFNMMIIADDEEVNNACKLELSVEPGDIVEAKITLRRFDQVTGDSLPTEVAILRDNIELSFSAIVSEVH
jgi:hypothetical protein